MCVDTVVEKRTFKYLLGETLQMLVSMEFMSFRFIYFSKYADDFSIFFFFFGPPAIVSLIMDKKTQKTENLILLLLCILKGTSV